MISHYLTLSKLTSEFRLLIGCRIIECFSQEKDSANLIFFDSERLFPLYFSGIPNFETIFFSDSNNRKKKNSIDIFKDLIGDVLQDIELLTNSRIIKFSFINSIVYFQLFGGSRNNIIITSFDNTIINSLSSSKELIGKQYIQNTPSFFLIDSLPKDQKISKVLAYSEFLLGKYYTNEFLIINKLDSEKLISDFSLEELTDIVNKAHIFRKQIDHSSNSFILNHSVNLNDVIFSLIPLTNYKIVKSTFGNPSELVKKVFLKRISEKKFKDKIKEIRNFALQEFKRSQKQMMSLENEKLKLNLIDKYSLYSELLYTYNNIKERGLSNLKLYDYNNNLIEIELNPKYSIIENIENFYKKIKNLKKSILINSERKVIIEEDFYKAKNRLDELDIISDLKSLKIHFKNNEKFYKFKMAKAEKEISERFKTFVLSEDATLYVGKDSKNNDELTFRFGKPNDYWFHLRGGSGSHCILKFTGKGNPPKEIIEKSASIAAYYSSQRNGGYVPVVYTQRKYVRKPKGANPGAVVIAKEDVILIEPKIFS